jgi:hypothetical protein
MLEQLKAMEANVIEMVDTKEAGLLINAEALQRF